MYYEEKLEKAADIFDEVASSVEKDITHRLCFLEGVRWALDNVKDILSDQQIDTLVAGINLGFAAANKQLSERMNILERKIGKFEERMQTPKSN